MTVYFAESTSGSGGVRKHKYYDYSWSYAFRPKSDSVAEKIAYTAEIAVSKKNIKYKKNDISFYNQLKKHNWDIKKVTEKCYAACTQFCSACINAAGVSCKANVNSKMLITALKGNSKFNIAMSGSKIKSSKLRRGDILISYHANGKKHGVVVISSGSDAPKLDISTTGSGSSKNTTQTVSVSNTAIKYYESYSSSAPTLALSKGMETVINDWEKLNRYYPNECAKYLVAIKQMKNINTSNLVKQYKAMVNILIKQLIKTNNTSDIYLYFLNNTDGLMKVNSINYIPDNYTYYMVSNIDLYEWLELYNDLCLKKLAIDYYIAAKNNYTTALITQEYLLGLKHDLSLFYDNQLIDIYNQLNDYVNNNIQMINTENSITIINNQIQELEKTINLQRRESYVIEPNIKTLNSELDKYKIILENLLKTKQGFKVNNFSDDYVYWNKKIIQEPNLLKFWLEFSNSNEMENYVIQNIGCKSYSANNENVKSIYYREVPTVIYYEDDNIQKNKTGYNYLKINNINTLFKNSAQGLSAKNAIDNLLYQHSYCAEELTLTIVPIHYLEPNTRILIYNQDASINGEYIVNKITNPISYNGTMTINATKVTERLY